MFPNNLCPFSVPFMLERAKALSHHIHLEVVSPVGFFPIVKDRLPELHGSIDGLSMHHPRYLTLPSLLWSLRWYPYLLAFRSHWKNLQFKCEMLHVEWIYPDAYAAVKLAKPKGVKTVGVVHGNEAIEYFGPARHRKKYMEAFDRLDHIIVVSDDLKHKLINEYSVDSGKISVILNGVNVEKFPLTDKDYARSKLGISGKAPVGVCVARLSEEKNLDILIKVAATLKNEAPLIYIVGDGPLRKKLQTLINDLGMQTKIKLVGVVPHDDVALWLNAANFFYLPSRREGCPVVVHEALACGVPVIATAVGAIPDLVKNDRYGLLCEPDNVTAFADIMKRAVSMNWDRNAISAYGRQFTWDKMAMETVKLYDSLIKRA